MFNLMDKMRDQAMPDQYGGGEDPLLRDAADYLDQLLHYVRHQDCCNIVTDGQCDVACSCGLTTLLREMRHYG